MFASPLGLLALLTIPAVVGLHLYRRRTRQRVVSAVFLWDDLDRSAAAGRQRQPLHQSPSFWLELLVAALLALALAGPQGLAGGQAEHRVIVLDASASMDANRDDAQDEVRALLKGIGARGRVSIVTSGPRPRMLVGPAALREEALARLDDYAPAQPAHDLGPAVDLASELAQGGAVWLVTDRFDAEAWPETVGVVAVGAPQDNVGLVQATRVRGRDGDAVYLALRSFSSVPVTGTLTLSAAGQVLAERAVELPPGQTASLDLTLPPDVGMVQVQLRATTGNALTVDDAAWLAPLPPRTLGLSSTLSPATEAALGLGADLNRWATLIDDAVVADAGAHLVLSHDPTAGGANAWVVVLPTETGGGGLIGPYLIEQQHVLLQGVDLNGVIWTPPLETVPGRPLIAAGQQPLLTEEPPSGGRRVLHLNLDPRASTLSRSPDWPIFLLNLAEARREELPGPSATTVLVGQRVVWSGAREGAWRIEGPVSRDLTHAQDVVIDGLRRPGVYTVSRDGVAQAEIAVNLLDPAESDLGGRSAGDRAPTVAATKVGSDLSALDTVLLALALLLLLLDWWVLSRGDSLGLAGLLPPRKEAA